MRLIVGLGNPDKIFDKTFHNIGFMAIDKFAQMNGATFSKSECKAKTAHILIDGEKIILAKPQTYMNLSGESVIALTAKYKIDKQDLIVVYDDIDLELGTVRIRESGSAGTHNGMRNIVLNIGTQDFSRLRIGIGRSQNSQMDLKDYVLSKISGDAEIKMNETFESVGGALSLFCSGIEIQKIMQKYNSSKTL